MKPIRRIGRDIAVWQDGTSVVFALERQSLQMTFESHQIPDAIAALAQVLAETLCGEVARTEFCTAPDAVWCPAHGNCMCPDEDRDHHHNPMCPLHGAASTHGT